MLGHGRCDDDAGVDEGRLAAAVAWYEDRREGLGLELIAEVTLCSRRSLAAPAAFPSTPGWHWSLAFVAPLPGAFLISIAFIDLATVIRVLAVAHEKRRPGYWVGRLKGP